MTSPGRPSCSLANNVHAYMRVCLAGSRIAGMQRHQWQACTWEPCVSAKALPACVIGNEIGDSGIGGLVIRAPSMGRSSAKSSAIEPAAFSTGGGSCAASPAATSLTRSSSHVTLLASQTRLMEVLCLIYSLLTACRGVQPVVRIRSTLASSAHGEQRASCLSSVSKSVDIGWAYAASCVGI